MGRLGISFMQYTDYTQVFMCMWGSQDVYLDVVRPKYDPATHSEAHVEDSSTHQEAHDVWNGFLQCHDKYLQTYDHSKVKWEQQRNDTLDGVT